MTSMDLGLNLHKSNMRGRKPVDLQVCGTGELSRADVELLKVERGLKAPTLKRLSDRHHALARDIAWGMTTSEAAVYHGYAYTRVCMLKADPSFQELVNHYRKIPDQHRADVIERMTGMTVDAVEELRRRLEDEPEDMSVGQLIEITKLGADRTGSGPQSSSLNVHVHTGLAEKLEAARKRVAKMRDVTPEKED